MPQVTDPAILAQLEGNPAPTTTAPPAAGPGGLVPVTDPKILDQLNASELQPVTVNAQRVTVPPQQSPHALGELASGVVRPFINAIGGTAMMPLEAGMETGHMLSNLARGIHPTLADFNPWAKSGGSQRPSYEMPMQALQRVENYYTTPPTSFMGKLAEFINSNVVGMGLPTGDLIAKPAPEGFVSNAQQALKDQALRTAQEKGYVVPPSSNNPSAWTRMLEGFAGKAKTKQAAQGINEQVTQRLAAQSIGQNPEAPIIPGSLPLIRAEAAATGYEPLRSIGTIKADPEYLGAIDSVTKSVTGAEQSFPGIAPASSELQATAKSIRQPQFDASAAVDAISLIRDKATAAYNAGNKGLGASFRQLSNALESQIERHLAGASQGADVQSATNAADMLANYRNARTLMAKTYTLGTALADESGTVNPLAFGNALARGKYLSGDQRVIGDFARNFKDFAHLPPGSQPLGSPLDWYGSVGLAGLMHNPLPLLMPFARTGAQKFLLSPHGQSLAFRTMPVIPTHLGLPGALPVSGYYLSDSEFPSMPTELPPIAGKAVDMAKEYATRSAGQ